MPTAWLAGPVAITGASGQVGMALQHRLAHLPNEIRPLGRHDDLAAAFNGADAVVHLAGTLRPRRPDSYEAANLETVAATVAALRGAHVKRLVFLSYIDADPTSANPYLRCKGEAEELVRRCDTPAVIFRATHVYGPPEEPGPTAAAMLSRHGKPVSVLGTGTQRYSWVAKTDVVDAIAHAALDPGTGTGTFELAGPQPLTVDEFVRHVNGEDVQIRHLPATVARFLGHVLPALPAPLVDVMLRDCLPSGDPLETSRRFDVPLHRLAEAWPRQ